MRPATATAKSTAPMRRGHDLGLPGPSRVARRGCPNLPNNANCTHQDVVVPSSGWRVSAEALRKWTASKLHRLRSEPPRTYSRGSRAKSNTRNRWNCSGTSSEQRTSLRGDVEREELPQPGRLDLHHPLGVVGLVERQHVEPQAVADVLRGPHDPPGEVVPAGMP